MKCKKLRKLLSVALTVVMLCATSITVFAAEDPTPAAPNDSLSDVQYPTPRASLSKTIKTDTGGTLTANVWLSSIFSNDLIDYQVSAQYNKTDHYKP